MNTNFIPMTKFPQIYPEWSYTALRWLRNLENINGCAKYKVFKKPAGRVLIDTTAFFRWVDEHKQSA